MSNKKRKLYTAAALKEESFLVRIARSALVICTIFACALVPGMFERPVILPQCVESGIPNVIFDQQANGELIRDGRKFLVRELSGKVRPLAKCAKNGCSGPYAMLEKERIGIPIHAEFCGQFLTSVSLNDAVVYTAHPPTQAYLDEKAAKAHKVGLFSLLFVLVVLLGSILVYVHKHRASKASR